MSKIQKILFVGIGDVGALAVFKAIPPQNSFNFDGVNYPTMIRMDYLNAVSEEAYLENVNKLCGENTLIVYVVNKQVPRDFITYQKWISEIQHYHMQSENYINKNYLLFSVGRDEDLSVTRTTIIDALANAIKQCNEPVVEVPDTPKPELNYGKDGKVDSDIPRKVIVAIGSSSCLLLNIARFDQSSNPNAGFTFTHERDDYYLMPEALNDDVENAFKEINERHTKFNEYVLLVDDALFSNQTIENFHIRLLAVAQQDSVRLLIISHGYNGESDAQHALYMQTLKESLSSAEEAVKQHPLLEKEVKDEVVQQEPQLSDNIPARKIIFVYGHEALNVLRWLDHNYSNYSSDPAEILIDRKTDIVIEHPALSIAVANFDIGQLGKYYNEDCEVYLLGDKDILASEAGAYLRDHFSSITDGRYSFTTVQARNPKYPNIYDNSLGLIINDFRGMKKRLDYLENPNNVNPTQQENKMNQDQNEQQETKEAESLGCQQQITAALKPVWERFHGVAQMQNELKAALSQIQMTLRHGNLIGPLYRPNEALDPNNILFPGPANMWMPFNNPGSAGMFAPPRFPFGAPSTPPRPFGNFANMNQNPRSPRDTITRESEERTQSSLYPASAGRDFPTPEGGIGRSFDGTFATPMSKHAPSEHHFDEDAYEVLEGIPTGLIRKVKPIGIVQPKNNGKKEILILSLSRFTSTGVVDVLRSMYAAHPDPIDEIVTLTFGDLDSFNEGKFVGFEEICIVYKHGDLPAENYAASKRNELDKQHKVVNPEVSFRHISDRQFGSYLYGIWQGYVIGFDYGKRSARF